MTPSAAQRARRRLSTLPSLRRFPVALLCMAAVAYAVALALNGLTLLRGLLWEADAVAPLAVAADLHLPSSGSTYLGNSGQPNYVFIDLATRWLPGAHRLWEAWPYAVSLLAMALLVFIVFRLAGGRAALLAGVLVFACSPLGFSALWPLMSQNFHGLTDANVVVLVALTAMLARAAAGAPAATRGALDAAAIAAGLLTGFDAAADALLLLAGVVPFLVAAAVVLVHARARRRRALLLCAEVLGGGVAGALLLRGLDAAAHVVFGGLGVTLALDHVPGNIGILGGSLAELAGFQPDATAPGTFVFGLVAGIVIVSASSMLLWRCARRPGAASPLSGVLSFAAASMFLEVVGFVVSSAPVDVTAARYLTPLFIAGVMVAGVVASRTQIRYAAAAAGTAVIVAANIVAFGQVQYRPPRTAGAESVIRTLEAMRLSRGYADFWQALAISWNTGSRLFVRPVVQGAPYCGGDATTVCPYLFNAEQGWFAPAPGASFVITDPAGSMRLQPSEQRFGAPVRVLHLGVYVVYVFAYDVATRMPPGFAPALAAPSRG